MKTYRITENEIKGMKVLATGYKAFKNDWTSKHGNYSYADENGEVLNSIHKVDGELIMCENGLHFSHNPLDCFKYYEKV